VRGQLRQRGPEVLEVEPRALLGKRGEPLQRIL
jgi:hypothetical protein